MKAFFRELFEYNHHFNTKLFSMMNENRDRISEQSVRLASHIVNVHRIWNYKIEPGEGQAKPWDLQRMEVLIEHQHKNHHDSLAILNKFDLDTIINYSLSSGKSFQHPVRDLLFQIINHSTYHRAQVATEIRKSGLEPLLTDYIFYKMTT